MVAENALEQRRAGARHADDEDRHRPVEPMRGRARELAVAARDDRVEQGLLVLDPVFQALVHHRVGTSQRRPGFLVATEVLELLVLRELEGGMVLAALLDLLAAASK